MILLQLPTQYVNVHERNGHTHVNKVGLEPLVQVLQKGVLALIVFQQNRVLHANVISLMQRALHVAFDVSEKMFSYIVLQGLFCYLFCYLLRKLPSQVMRLQQETDCDIHEYRGSNTRRWAWDDRPFRGCRDVGALFSRAGIYI